MSTQTRPPNSTKLNCCDGWITGLNTAHCTACHANFTSPRGFDAHRTGSHGWSSRRCIDPAAMVHGPDNKLAGQPVFKSASRAYPCWTFNEDNPLWSEAA